MAKAAGMKYAVITTKHHEGFGLFKTGLYGLSGSERSLVPQKDLIRSGWEAFRAEGLKVGFYYSLLDWQPSGL